MARPIGDVAQQRFVAPGVLQDGPDDPPRDSPVPTWIKRIALRGLSLRPEWTSDGKYVVFVSTRGDKVGIFRQPADGSGPAELLYQPEYEPFEALVSPDNQWLVFRTAPGAKYSRDILAVRLTGKDRTIVPIVVPV